MSASGLHIQSFRRLKNNGGIPSGPADRLHFIVVNERAMSDSLTVMISSKLTKFTSLHWGSTPLSVVATDANYWLKMAALSLSSVTIEPLSSTIAPTLVRFDSLALTNL